jgi:hypothetical protein
MIFNHVYTIGFYVPLDPLAYWSEWLWKYAGLGVYLIIIGYRYIIRSTKD